MREFELSILTPMGGGLSVSVQELYVRTVDGEVGLMAGHTDYLAGIVPCAASYTDNAGKVRAAFCGGGFLSVIAGKATLAVDEFVFAEDLNAEAVKAERDALTAELAACDVKKEPERAQYIKDALARVAAKAKAISER